MSTIEPPGLRTHRGGLSTGRSGAPRKSSSTSLASGGLPKEGTSVSCVLLASGAYALVSEDFSSGTG